eukprot:TRINITY_DN898_c1_g1_i1.p1 TRINITY_DN898_c1_g1~~TRINITY_DN898_c1_g1_i1.p1  ORF type:complete len:562 (-),score=69.87 TRINITY_DN898_c1_g1_i1:230-1915(-)
MDSKAFEVAMQQMQRMTPEQLAEVQRQAANFSPDMTQQAMRQMQNMSSSDWSRLQQVADNMTPSQMAAASGTASQRFQAQQQYQLQGAVSLKEQGNNLHKQGQYSEAIAKYQQALRNLDNSGSDQKAVDLQKACRLNLAMCYLKLGNDAACVKICDEILAVDRENMKALYRRGQALGNLGSYSSAITDLQHAKRLVPDNDIQQLELIQEKLDAFKIKFDTDGDQAIIEEIDENPRHTQFQHSHQDDGPVIQEVDENEKVENKFYSQSNSQQYQQSSSSSQTNHEEMFDTAMQMKDNPELFRQYKETISQMSDEQIRQQLKMFGVGEVTSEMIAKMREGVDGLSQKQVAEAAKKMKNAPLKYSDGQGTQPQSPLRDPAQMQQMLEMMKKSPDMMKKMSETVSNLSAEQLSALSSAQGGGAMNPEMLKAASKMMANMTPEDMERISGFATQSSSQTGGQPDPSSMMKDPKMMESAMSMMQNMSENELAQFLKQMSPGMSEEMARTSAQSMKSLSPGQMKILMQLQSFAQKLGSVKSAILGKMGLVITILILIVAMLLRFYGVL